MSLTSVLALVARSLHAKMALRTWIRDTWSCPWNHRLMRSLSERKLTSLESAISSHGSWSASLMNHEANAAVLPRCGN